MKVVDVIFKYICILRHKIWAILSTDSISALLQPTLLWNG